MTAQAETTMYVWRRNTEAHSHRWAWWVIGGIVALSGFGAFAAYMADDTGSISTFISLGAIGSVLFWLIPRVYDWGRRRNPDIVMEGREMVWSKVRVPIDQVDRWHATRSRVSSYNGTMHGTMTIGVVTFQMMDTEKPKKLNFPHLTEAELADLIAAIEPVLPGRRIE